MLKAKAFPQASKSYSFPKTPIALSWKLRGLINIKSTEYLQS